jgi:2-methylisocitrate lyase-like PEP mutase family enzyme
LGTTSAGHAWSLGKPDGQVSRAMVLEHLRQIVAATEVPTNAELNGLLEKSS